MKTVSSIALVVVSIVLATASFSHAATHGGPGFSGHPSSGHFESHRGFEDHHGFERRGGFDRRSHGGVFIGVPFDSAPADPDEYTPAYAPPEPAYWYYCPSYGAYYPTVPSCSEAWVPVAAQ